MLKIKKFSKNVFVIFSIFLFAVFMIPFNNSVAAGNISIKGPSIVMEGQSAVFDVTYANNVIYINLSSGDVILNGFQATVSVSGSGNTRKVVLTNVRGVGNGRSITINSGTGHVGAEKVGAVTSSGFTIKGNNTNNNNNTLPVKPANPVQNKPTVNNNDQDKEQNNDKKEDEKKDEIKEDNKEDKKDENEQDKEKEDENIDYNEQIPIPNTGKNI